MIRFIEKPSEIRASGNKEKLIQEFVGNVNTKTSEVSIAKMVSPEGWEESGQTPQFDEYTIVLSGILRIETEKGVFDIKAGQAVLVERNEWVKYSTPYPGGAEYIAICRPAFSPSLVNRDLK